MPDQKDVADKLKLIMEKLKTVVNGTKQTKIRERVGLVAKGKNPGLNALRQIITRQVEAQINSHGLDRKLVIGPPTKWSQDTSWNSSWMTMMTMWLDAMIDEIQEVRGWLNWKSWKKPHALSENDVVNARLELIDLLHFWINAYVMLGGDAESIVVEYHAKRDENDLRQKEGY